MRALAVIAEGGTPALAEVPTPHATPGTVLVRVRAAGLNPVDNAIGAGMVAAFMAHEYPVVLGRDAAGVVEAVGAGVANVSVGDEVLGHVRFEPPIHAGTVAEQAVLSGETVAAKPAGLDFVAAAALPLAGATAVLAVDAIGAQPGEVILVVGASGGVGSFVVQLLRDLGARVVATGRPEDAERLRGLGAVDVLDYTAGNLASDLRARYPEGADALIDLAGRTTEDLPLGALKDGARIASPVGAADPETLADKGFQGTNLMARPTRDVVSELAEKAAAGHLKVDVQRVVALDEAPDALGELAKDHTRGKTVVRIPR